MVIAQGAKRFFNRPWFWALLSDKLTAASALFLGFIVIGVAFWPYISPYDVTKQNLGHVLLPPFSLEEGNFYILGTDGLGRDLFTRLMDGGRISLSLGLVVVLASGTIGVTLGLLAGFYRGWVDDVIMRAVDAFMTIPTLFFVLIILYTIGSGTVNMIAVLAIARWMLYCRVTRGLVLSMREADFIVATRAIGASDIRVLVRHILPNLVAAVLTVGTIDVARVILLESGLSFLGMGLQPPEVSWGVMVAGGRRYIRTAWWLITVPGAAIFLAALSINMFGLWLRAISDPLQRWRWLKVPSE